MKSAATAPPPSRANHHNNRRRKQQQKPNYPKLPHILSESNPSSSPRSQRSNFTEAAAGGGYGGGFTPTAYQANSTYSSTPSQASSIWNWENFYPPSPPDSEFFNNRARAQENRPSSNHDLNSETEEEGTETETERSQYDFFNAAKAKQDNSRYEKHHDFAASEAMEREEVQCSEWGDHYSTTSSSADEDDDDDRDSRSDLGVRSNFGSSARTESVAPRPHPHPPPPAAKSEDYSSASYGEISDLKMVVRHKDLKEIVEAIKEHFEKAAAAGDQVSEMLEIGRAQLDRSFKQLKSMNCH